MAGAWTKLTATVRTEYSDRAASVISMLDNGLMIEDFSDFSLNGMYGELVDESILNADRDNVKISIFVPEEKNITEFVEFIKTRFGELKIPYSLTLDGVLEEDWAESWKQYFKPIRLGRLTVAPAWENYEGEDGEVVIKLDPGMAFGTGNHETTRLVMKILQDEISGGERVLDVGCGSGILSVCASKLGASFCAAYDIDPVAVRVAEENAREDGVTNMICGVSDLLASVDTSGGLYDFAVANIVADIIIRLSPDIGDYLLPGGRLVVSGIITERAPEVRAALAANGFEIIREAAENDWLAILCRKA